jgi:hypothetical protein
LWGARPISARRYGALVSNLPVDCALHRAHLPREYRETGWDDSKELVALVFDAIGVLNANFVQAWSTGNGTVKPMRIPRPQDLIAKPVSARDDMIRFFRAAGGVKYTPKAPAAN